MKPPSRRRSAPARYAVGPVVQQVWTDREKRRLLKALRAQGEGPLRPELLKKYLPWRDEAEILAFVQLLKERVAKEAVKAQYQSLKHQRQNDPIPAPIEVWTQLAEKLTGNLEHSETTAFSQVLTVASAEPLSLLHSVPPKPVDAKTQQCSSPAEHDERREDSQTVILPSNAEQAPAEEQGFHVDFERIYKYLSMLSCGSKAPELSPGVHTITRKPMSWHDNLEEPADAKFLKLIHHAALEPTKKYKEPQTESQEIGWFSTPLISTDRSDRRLNFPSRSTEITKYMAAMWRLKEMMKDKR